nr:MAG TPA: hypothetical protein [Caudoviricetes sp.]
MITEFHRFRTSLNFFCRNSFFYCVVISCFEFPNIRKSSHFSPSNKTIICLDH